jgi:hypothetical protein
MSRIANLLFAGIVCVIASMVVVAATNTGATKVADTHLGDLTTSVGDSKPTDVGNPALFDIHVRQPEGPPRIELAGQDPQGRMASVACSTCHSVRKPNLDNKTASALDEFHQGMTMVHGNLACYACHHPDHPDALRLADGSVLAFTDVLTLCSQCHSKQAESFAHGAHGGMNGHWDLSRGPQFKNNCVDCHDPHAPSYPKMIVGFKPKDRFNNPIDPEHAPAGVDSHDH